jgi:hypothetical protein
MGDVLEVGLGGGTEDECLYAFLLPFSVCVFVCLSARCFGKSVGEEKEWEREGVAAFEQRSYTSEPKN